MALFSIAFPHELSVILLGVVMVHKPRQGPGEAPIGRSNRLKTDSVLRKQVQPLRLEMLLADAL